MGSWAYYAASLRFSDVAARVQFAHEVHGRDRQLNELIQRSLEKSASDIAMYLERQHDERFFNALVVGVYQGDPQWFSATMNPSERIDPEQLPAYARQALGILAFDGSERLFALDGQHRVEGIRQALRHDPTLGDEQVAVLFVGHQNTPEGMRRTRRLFTTLNRYAKPVSKSDLIALDEDDAVAIVTRSLVMEHPLFHQRTSTKKPKSLLPADRVSVTTIGALYDAMNSYVRMDRNLIGHDWTMYKRFRPSDEDLEVMKMRAVAFWNRAADAVATLRQVRDGPLGVAGSLRPRETGGDLWVRPIGTMMFVDVFTWLRTAGLTEVDAIQRLAAAPSSLNSAPWTGLLWDPINKRMITRAENRRVASHVLYYLCGGQLGRLKSSLDNLRSELEGLTSGLLGERPRLPRPHAAPIRD